MSVQDSETLRQQFRLIQEQQQKKLLARKQKKTKKSDKTQEENSDGGVSQSLWSTEDDLGLKLDVNIEDGQTLNSELQELKDGIRVLKDENGRLYKLLGERDEEMRITRKQRDNERKALAGTGMAADTAAGKIVELSKKNREMTADLQSERNKVRQLARKNQELEQQVKHIIGQDKPQQQTKNGNREEDSGELAMIQEKLNHANHKMAEYRNQCEALKKEMKIATKVLSKEMGDSVNITALLNEPSGYRGRQQQILSLQNKVTELKGQLHQVARTGSSISSNTLLRSSMATPLFSGSQYDEKHKSALRGIEKGRKDAQEKTQVELEKMTEQQSRLQQKHEAAKARNTVLANELKSLKAQIKTLLEKGAHDNELIAALMREQQLLKESRKERAAPSPSPPKMVVAQADTVMINHLRQVCQEREERVKFLENQLKEAREELRNSTAKLEAAPQRPQTSSKGCSTEDLPTSQSYPGMQSRDAQALKPSEEERGRRSRYEDNGPVPGSPNRRNVVSRGSVAGAHGSLPPTPPSGGRPGRARRNSTSSSDEVHLLRCQLQEAKSLCQAAEVERDRLLELVSVLQKRTDEECSKSLEATTKWQEQRRINAHLEKKLGRVQSSTSKLPSTGKGKSRGGAVQRSEAEERAAFDELQEAQTRLEIQTDENDALKEALQSTLRSKEEDMKYYQKMMEQTKKIFLHGLRQFRQGSAPS